MFPADLERGDGFLVRSSFRLEPAEGPFEFGATYARTEHEVRDTFASAEVHQAFADVRIAPSFDLGLVRLEASMGFGLGGVRIEFDSVFGDTGGLMFTGGGRLGLAVADHFTMAAGVGVFAWGYPGEWLGEGGMFTLEGGVKF